MNLTSYIVQYLISEYHDTLSMYVGIKMIDLSRSPVAFGIIWNTYRQKDSVIRLIKNVCKYL